MIANSFAEYFNALKNIMSNYHKENELDRLAFVRRLEMIDAECEPIYNDFTELAAVICGTPISILTLLDQERQWFVSKKGVPFNETPRQISFCTYTIQSPEPLIIPDTTKDQFFKDHFFTVTDPYNVRFYAGVPIEVEGYPVGTICVFDQKPRQLAESQITALSILSRQLTHALEQRLAIVRERDQNDNLQIVKNIFEYSRNRFESLFLNLSVAIYTTDLNGCVVEINRKAESLFGVKGHIIVGSSDVHTLQIESDIKVFKCARDKAWKGTPISGLEVKFQKPDGSELWTICNIQPIFAPTGETLGLIFVFNDIGDRKALEGELIEINSALENLSNTDGLTNLANRRHLVSQLNLAYSESAKAHIGLMLIDVDHFKSYNDDFGHPAGDEALKLVAQIIQQNVPNTCHVGRYGGEEFMVLVPESLVDQSIEIGERIRSAVATHLWPLRGITVSIGIARSTAEIPTPDHLISLADVRLYQAKGDGRDQVVGFGNRRPNKNKPAA